MVPWRSVPDAACDAWRQAFAVPGGAAAGVDVAVPCPVCGEARLHRYYQVGAPLAAGISAAGFVARGALWEWCSACRCYEHASALVPAWWRGDLAVDEARLTAQPDVLEAALRGRRRPRARLRARAASQGGRMKRLLASLALAACHPHRRPSPPPPVETARAQIAAARASLAAAERHWADGDYRAAYDATLRGVDALGRDYAKPTTKDDTGLHLLLAGEPAKAGKVIDAAEEAMESLRARIAQYEARYR